VYDGHFLAKIQASKTPLSLPAKIRQITPSPSAQPIARGPAHLIVRRRTIGYSPVSECFAQYFNIHVGKFVKNHL
jgi:hypothetical protein